MRRLTGSPGYGRAKAVNGVLFGVLGIAVVGRTISSAGIRPAALPGIILGLAMIGLAAVRVFGRTGSPQR